MTRAGKKSCRKWDSNPGSSALEADALTTKPLRPCVWELHTVLDRSRLAGDARATHRYRHISKPCKSLIDSHGLHKHFKKSQFYLCLLVWYWFLLLLRVLEALLRCLYSCFWPTLILKSRIRTATSYALILSLRSTVKYLVSTPPPPPP